MTKYARHSFTIAFIAVVAAAAGCSSGPDSSVKIPEALGKSCLRSPYASHGVSFKDFVGFFEMKQASISLEQAGEGYILRTSITDALTREEAAFSFEITLDEAAQLTGETACGPGVSKISRALTPDGVVSGIVLDALIGQIALAIKPEPAVPNTPPVPTQQPYNPPFEGEDAASAEAAVMSRKPRADDATGRCTVRVDGATIMQGACDGKFHPERVILGAHDGCHVELRWSPDQSTAQAFVYSYRNPCVNPATDETIDYDIPLGTVTRNGQCWRNDSVEVCLN